MQLYYRTERREARKLDEDRQEAAILLLGASRFLTTEAFVRFPFVSAGSRIVLQMRRDLQIYVIPRVYEFTGSVQEATNPRCFLPRSFPITDNWPRRFARFLLYSFARISNWAKTQFSSLDPYRISYQTPPLFLSITEPCPRKFVVPFDILYFPCIATWMANPTLLPESRIF